MSQVAQLENERQDGKTELQHLDSPNGENELENKGGLSVGTVHVTEADNKRILRKTDLVILSALVSIYFLQTADKTIIGLTAVYGLRADAHLSAAEYSQVGAIGYYAQLVAQPLAAFVLVKLNYRLLVPVLVSCWALTLFGLSASSSYAPFMACRFLLGFFEAAAIPLFSVITISWYRRSEQPLRIAAWYGQNGMANVICSPLIFGLAKIKNPKIHLYQSTYIMFGIITLIIGVASWWWLSDSPANARFLSQEDRLKAVERLKANQQGVRSYKFQPKQILEAFTETKLYLFLILTCCINIGASTSSVFGPIIIKQIIGFSSDQSTLLNIPYGVLQTIMILLGSYLAQRFHKKGIILFFFMLPVIAGTAMLYALPKTKANQGPLLLGYYLFSFLYAGNPLVLSWMGANCAGQTKKSTYYTAFNAASAVGNIIAPNIFRAEWAPLYKPSLQGVFVVFAICAGVTLLQIFNIMRLQKQKERARVAAGLPAKHIDYSMQNHYHEAVEEVGEGGLEDQTDQQNLNFIYLV